MFYQQLDKKNYSFIILVFIFKTTLYKLLLHYYIDATFVVLCDVIKSYIFIFTAFYINIFFQHVFLSFVNKYVQKTQVETLIYKYKKI